MKIVRYYFVYISFSHTFIADTLLNFPDATKTTKHHEYYFIDEKRTDFEKGREILGSYPVPLAECARMMCSFFSLQRTFFICSVCFLFAAFLLRLQRFFYVCSLSFMFEAFAFCLQRFFIVCSILFCLQHFFFVCSLSFMFAACPLWAIVNYGRSGISLNFLFHHKTTYKVKISCT